jgi:UDPglucose 6-dehydrogenase
MAEAKHLLHGVSFQAGAYRGRGGADALVILTEWDQFRALDLDRIAGSMRQPVLVDLRNVYRPDEVRAHGFTYVSIGRA